MATSGGCDMATYRGCFWMVTMGSAQEIVGIGKNEREAIQNGMAQIGGNVFTPVMFECFPCTLALYKAIHQHGAVGLSWELDEFGVARLVDANS